MVDSIVPEEISSAGGNLQLNHELVSHRSSHAPARLFQRGCRAYDSLVSSVHYGLIRMIQGAPADVVDASGVSPVPRCIS